MQVQSRKHLVEERRVSASACDGERVEQFLVVVNVGGIDVHRTREFLADDADVVDVQGHVSPYGSGYR